MTPAEGNPSEASCLDDDAATAFVEGRLSKSASDRVFSHVDRCSPCRRLLSEWGRIAVDDCEPTALGRSSARARRTLHAEEAARAASFGRVIAILCLVVLLLKPNLASQAWLRHATDLTLIGLGLVAAWVWRRAGDADRYDRRVFRILALACTLSIPTFIYYGGVYSPSSAAAVMLGIGFLGLGDDRAFALGCCIAGIVIHLGLTALITARVIPDLGVFTAQSAPLAWRVFVMAVIPVVYLVTLWHARMARSATTTAVEQLDAALRTVGQREAQLDEAHQALDVALQGARQGRYTGETVGAYRLHELIGRGAFGEVYAAIDGRDGAVAAVKLLQMGVDEQPEQVRRLLREAEALCRLRAANVVQIYEVGESAQGAPYIAMELLSGDSLAGLLRVRQQLSPAEVVRMATEIAAGLAAAHDLGIVHRDIKPQNLFLAQHDGGASWKILDFGIAKLRGATDSTITRRGLIGTPAYMSPEQAQGHAADRRSDVFSLGAVVYRALTGRPPFRGRDVPRVLFQIVYHDPVPATTLVPSLPAAVDAVLAIALAKCPEDRFACAPDLARALERALGVVTPVESG